MAKHHFRPGQIHFTGYDGNGYTIGDRVEVHPGTDFWMRGARYATVVGSSITKRDRVKVEFDKLPGRKFAAPADYFKFVDKGPERNPRRKSRALSLSRIARVHARNPRKKRHTPKGFTPHLRRVIRRTGRKVYGKTYGHRKRRNPSQPPRSTPLFYVQVQRQQSWITYAACNTLERAKTVARAIARVERIPVRVTNRRDAD